MKKRLMALLKNKQEERTAKLAIVEKSTDVEELRGLQKDIEGINEEIRNLEGMIADIPEDEGVTERTAAVNGTPEIVGANATGQENRKSDEEKDMEYRKAFQQFVTKGTPIPAELRDDAVSATTDVAAAIPTPVVNRIIEKLETIGNILPLVNKTTYPAGMNIPQSKLKPTAVWVAEGAGSDKQKHDLKDAVVFTHYKLRCEVAITQEAAVMTIAAFENLLVKQVSEAMVKSIEDAIINGAWNSGGNALVGPKGILDETVATGQNEEVGASATLTYATLTNAEGKLPLAYEDGAKWFMTKTTFMKFMSMTDTDGQPIARVNYGLAGKPERYLLGREVILNEYMESYKDTVTNDTVVGFLFDPRDYTINTNYNLGIQKRQNWDNEDLETKAVMALDGKVTDKNSLVTITKKA